MTTGGYIHVTVQGATISGFMDNSGAWAVLASISEFSSLISEKNIDRLDDASCSMSKRPSRSKARAHRLRKMLPVVMCLGRWNVNVSDWLLWHWLLWGPSSPLLESSYNHDNRPHSLLGFCIQKEKHNFYNISSPTIKRIIGVLC